MIVEICCGSADDVIEAKKGGADRVELNSNLFHGGLTPTVGSLRVAKTATDMKILTMVRPREGGFCYTEVEFATMLEDAKQLLQSGADGIVFGFLTEDGGIDIQRCRRMMEVIGDKEAVFHRAFDVVSNWRTAMDELIKLKITRILTSGQNPSAYFGRDTIRNMIEYAAGRIEILPGAGINSENVCEFIKDTGCDQIHLAYHKPCFDNSTQLNPAIYFGGMLYPPEDRYYMIDKDGVSSLRELITT